jgi:hypothetical protein
MDGQTEERRPMAEAAEPRTPGAWPWIAGVIVLALAIWGLTRLLDVSPRMAAEPVPAPAAPAARP